MSLTDRLYAVAKPIWEGYLEQPFVKELGEGTLREDRFRFYMVQDYRYLLQYAKVFAMGVVKTEDEALMTRFSYMVHDTLDGDYGAGGSNHEIHTDEPVLYLLYAG